MKQTNKKVSIQEIWIADGQPRRTGLDKKSLTELTANIKTNGVIQAITVLEQAQPKGKGKYRLICGNRRLLATGFAGLKEIPAMILVGDMDEDKIRSIQLIENIQREGVQPLEEAEAIEQLSKSFDKKEIMVQLGISEYKMNQRVALVQLIAPWKKALREGRVAHTANLLRIAKMTAEGQKGIAKTACDSFGVKSLDKINEIEIRSHWVKNAESSLKSVPFSLDLELVTDDAKFPKCNGCPFNSQTAHLFPDENEYGTCSDSACYESKTAAQMHLLCAEAMENGMAFHTNNYYGDEEAEKLAESFGTKLLTSHHLRLLNDPNDYPLDSYKVWKKEEYGYTDEPPTEAEMKKEYAELKQDDENERKEFNEKTASGDFQKVLIVYGESKGQFRWYNPDDVKSSKATSSLPGKKVSEAALKKEQVQKIKDREVRAKELDAEKIFKALFNDEKNISAYTGLKAELTLLEWQHLVFAIYTDAGHMRKDAMAKAFGFPARGWSQRGKLFDDICKIEWNELNFAKFIRIWLLNSFTNNNDTDYTKSSAPKFAIESYREHYGDKVAEAEAEQQTKADKRALRVKANLDKLSAKPKTKKAK